MCGLLRKAELYNIDFLSFLNKASKLIQLGVSVIPLGASGREDSNFFFHCTFLSLLPLLVLLHRGNEKKQKSM